MNPSNQPPQIKQTPIIPAIIFAGALLYAFLSPGRSINPGPGISAPELPQQEPSELTEIDHPTYRIQVQSTYHCTAKLVAKRQYTDQWSDICPLDLTLGWKEMSDQRHFRYITVSQADRNTYVSSKKLPEELNPTELPIQINNVHACPANDEIRSQLLALPTGSVIQIKGKRVHLYHREFPRNAKNSLNKPDTKSVPNVILWIEELENKS